MFDLSFPAKGGGVIKECDYMKLSDFTYFMHSASALTVVSIGIFLSGLVNEVLSK